MRYFLLLLAFGSMTAGRAFGQESFSEAGNVTATTSLPAAEENVRFYPNPITNVLSITPSVDMDNVFVFVSDVRGRIVAKTAVTHMPAGEEFQYQMNDMSRGIYVFVLQSGDKQFAQRIMVQ